MLSSTTDYLVAGLAKKVKVTPSLHSFGFIPKKRSRDSPDDEITPLLSRLIMDPEQVDPVICLVPVTRNGAAVVNKELNHNPKSILARKRVITINDNDREKREYTNEQSTPEMVKFIINTYPNIFSALGSKKDILHCDMCLTEFKSAKPTHVLEHLNTLKHQKNSMKNLDNNKRVVKQRDFITEYFSTSRAKGESLDINTLAFRFDTVKVFLRNGVPMNKINGFRDYLEIIKGKKLTNANNLSQLIPPLLQEEIDTILNECKDCYLTVIFDGTTKVGEVFAIVFRYMLHMI